MGKRHIGFDIWWPERPDSWGFLRRYLIPHPGTLIMTLAVVGGLLWASSVGALPLRAPAAATTSTGTIAYQGRLADSAGDPITDTVNMEFRLYDMASGGTPLWSELWTGANAVRVSDGLFNVMLGSLAPIPQAVITGNDNLWLGITVGTDNEMEPRVQLGSVPFAVQALTVPDGSVTTQKLADGAVTQAKLGSDISLEPPDGSITTAKIADGAVTSAKLEHAGPHIPITPDENGLVKLAVLRQDDTTNSYSKDQVILTGWGWAQASPGEEFLEEDVSFGVTFSTPPVVILGNPGKSNSADPSAISDLTDNNRGTHISARNISTTGFTVWIQHVDIGASLNSGQRYGYSWIAIGTLE